MFFGTGPVTTGSAVFGFLIVDSKVPEPTTGVLLALGSGLALRFRRKWGSPFFRTGGEAAGQAQRRRRHSGLSRSSFHHRF